jgi:hypothetical protein
MDPDFYDRLWDEKREAWRSAKLYRTLAIKHPMVVKWLREDARNSDPAYNSLFFLYRPKFRYRTRLRRLRILNTLLLALHGERFFLGLDDDRKNFIVLRGWERARVLIHEEITGPVLPMSPSRSTFTGRLSCQIDAKLPRGIERLWADKPGAALETKIPNILATVAVWKAVLEVTRPEN